MTRVNTPMVLERVVVPPRRPATPKDKRTAYHRANGVCEVCDRPVKPEEAVYDHLIPRAITGRDGAEELRPLHKACHDEKFAPDMRDVAKCKRLAGETGNAPKRPIPGRPKPWPPAGTRKLRSRPFCDRGGAG